MEEKEEMLRLIDRRFELDRGDVPYEELVENEKERVEILMWDIIEKNPELEDMIPNPISWQ